MKYLMQALGLLSLPLMVNCSTIPDIQPYHPKELTIEDVKEASGFYKNGGFDEEPTTPLAEDDDAPAAKAEVAAKPMDNDMMDEPSAPAAEPVKAVASKDEPKEVENIKLVEEKTAVEEAPAVEKAVAPKAVKKTATRHQASVFKSGLHTFSQTCSMKSKPSDSGADEGTVQAGKKLWLDAHNGEWLKAYKKSGPVYVSADCIK